jgi:hypothetical protein
MDLFSPGLAERRTGPDVWRESKHPAHACFLVEACGIVALQLEPFGAEVGRHYCVPGDASARMREVRDQAGSDRIGCQDHDDGDRGCGALRFARPDRTVRDNHIKLAPDQVDGQLRYPSVIAAGGSPLCCAGISGGHTRDDEPLP